METLEAIDGEIKNASDAGEKIFLVFSGNGCKWCDRLKHIFEDGYFREFCHNSDIPLKWVVMGEKKAEEEAACSDQACRLTTRGKFGITSIPTVALFDAHGNMVAKTEFLEETSALGSVAYINWFRDYIWEKLSENDDDL